MSNQIGSALDNAKENIRYREQIESAATKNMLLGAILILAGIFGAYYFNNIYIKEEK